jgi:hypothetical protein
LWYNGVSVHNNPFDLDILLSIKHPELTIPLHISGTNIFLNTRTPTQHELDTCPHLHLTSEVEWNPQTMYLASSQSVEAEVNTSNTGGFNEVEPGLSQISCVYSFTAMVKTLHELCDVNSKQSISAAMTNVPGHRTFISKEWHSAISHARTIKWWSIGLAQSMQTL